MPMRRMIVMSALALGLLATPMMAQDRLPFAKRQPAMPRIDNVDKRLQRLSQSYVDGRNVVIASVNGKAITSAQIKAQLGSELETLTNTAMSGIPTDQRSGDMRKAAEFRVVFSRARSQIISDILLQEGKNAGLKAESNRAQVEALTQNIKDQHNIARGDLNTWAKYTLQNFNQTPLEFRDKMLEQHMRSQILSLMAGEYGAVKGLNLQVFLPLEVTPSEIRKEYKKTKKLERYSRSKDIAFDAFSISVPKATSTEDKVKLSDIVVEARRRVMAGESFKDVHEKYVKSEVKAQGLGSLPGLKIELQLGTKAASDADLDFIGRLTNDIDVDKYTQISTPDESVGDEERTYIVFAKLNARTTESKRQFSDPVVQKIIRETLKDRKRKRNRARVQELLIKRAVLFPKNLLGS